MKDDTSIVVENVSKVYRIWDSPAARARSLVWQTLRGIIPVGKGWFRKQEERHYADFPALKDISFTVARGESVAIIGRNGSGKSTLLQLIVGTLQPTNGTIKTQGRIAALLELGSGFDPEFTGRENVYLNAGILGLTKTETEARFADIEAFADIGDFIDQPVKTYSSGMMMRLAFAVIAHVDADILIVDEALAVGDVFFVQKCMRFIRKFQKTGTLLLVTHDTSAVTSLCQRAVWLHQGECEGIGTAKEIAELYLEAIYAERQGVTFKKDNSSKKNTVTVRNRPIKDQREKFIQHSNLRNDIKIFDFNRESSAFGAGGAVIEHVSLLEAQSGNQLSYVIGGEEVILRVEATSSIHLDRPIIGFSLKNHLGQELFGDNSFLTYLDSPYPVAENSRIVAQFRFQMPYLPAGNYMICAAIANGTQENHTQHHWLHEALAFQSHSSHCVGGLVGIPMLEITLSKETDISR